MFLLSAAAAAEIRATAPRSGAEGLALRVAARLDDDGALAFGMGFDEQRECDLPLEIDGVQLLIGQPSQPLLDGTVLDFVEIEPGQHGFVLAPQETPDDTPRGGGCGSGGCSGCKA